MFCERAVEFSTAIERRVFDVESIDADASIDRDAQNNRNLQRFAVCTQVEFDASRFSGTEQCIAGAPLISLQISNVAFATPNQSMRMPRSIEVLENGQIYSALQHVCQLKATHCGFRGPSNVLLARLRFLYGNRMSLFRC